MPVSGLVDTTTAAAIVSVSTSGVPGDQVALQGDVQYGGLLLPSTVGSELVGWRDTPDASASDTDRPQAHGVYPGDIWAGAATITLTYRLPGPPLVTQAAREQALRLIEANLPLDSVDRPLVVNDGDTTMRMARVLQRHVPRAWDFATARHLECSVQWLCADPRRYALTSTQATVGVPSSAGGLSYPLTYPLSYGVSQGGSRKVTNAGSSATLPQVVFFGPLTDPALVSDRGWRLEFDMTLAAGETLVVDTDGGTGLLNGDTDRLYLIANASAALDQCSLPPGDTTLTLTAAAGTGQAVISYRDAYL